MLSPVEIPSCAFSMVSTPELGEQQPPDICHESYQISRFHIFFIKPCIKLTRRKSANKPKKTCLDIVTKRITVCHIVNVLPFKGRKTRKRMTI